MTGSNAEDTFVVIDAGQVTICCHSRNIGTLMKDNDNGDGNGNENTNATDIGDDDDRDQVEEGVLYNKILSLKFKQIS